MSQPAGIFTCYHCGNRTPHGLALHHSTLQPYDEVEDEVLTEAFHWYGVICGTCNSLSLRGGFLFGPGHGAETPAVAANLYPTGPELAPPWHTVSPNDPIPAAVLDSYHDAWPLRALNPGAFANQIRRCLEFICHDQNAEGKSLADQLGNLSERGILPAELVQVAGLLRQIGNIASHADAKRIDRWDAELVDELFRTIIRYVYIAPALVRRMRERLGP